MAKIEITLTIIIAITLLTIITTTTILTITTTALNDPSPHLVSGYNKNN